MGDCPGPPLPRAAGLGLRTGGPGAAAASPRHPPTPRAAGSGSFPPPGGHRRSSGWPRAPAARGGAGDPPGAGSAPGADAAQGPGTARVGAGGPLRRRRGQRVSPSLDALFFFFNHYCFLGRCMRLLRLFCKGFPLLPAGPCRGQGSAGPARTASASSSHRAPGTPVGQLQLLSFLQLWPGWVASRKGLWKAEGLSPWPFCFFLASAEVTG